MFDFTQLRPEHLRILETLAPCQPGHSTVVPTPRALEWPPSSEDAYANFNRYSFRPWDLAIRPDDQDYIFRWHLVPRNVAGGNVYLHLQVADDPERPLHDHPWDNQSVILAGGYRELYIEHPETSWQLQERLVLEGRVVHRRAEEAHRIFLTPASGVPYTISLFTTGPVVRDWGFWFVDNLQQPTRCHWHSHDAVVINDRFIGEPHV